MSVVRIRAWRSKLPAVGLHGSVFDGEDFEKEKVASRGNKRFILREGPRKLVEISNHGATIEDIDISIDHRRRGRNSRVAMQTFVKIAPSLLHFQAISLMQRNTDRELS